MIVRIMLTSIGIFRPNHRSTNEVTEQNYLSHRQKKTKSFRILDMFLFNRV